MFCSNCGSKIDDAAKFCQNCGHPVKMQAESAVAGVVSETTTDTTSEDVEAVGAVVSEETSSAVTSGDDESVTAETPVSENAEASGTEAPAETGSASGTIGSDSIEENVVQTQGTVETQVTDTADAMNDAAAAGVFAAGTAASGNDDGDTAPADSSVTAQYARRIAEEKPTQDAASGQFSQTQNGTPNGQFNQTQNNNLNGGINVGQGYNVPQPKSTISTVGQVLCIAALVLMFFQFFRVIGSAFGILGSMSDEGLLGFLYGIINFGVNILKMCGLVISALVMYLIWKKWDDDKVEPLMVGTMTGGALILLTIVLRVILSSFFNFAFGYHYANLWSGAFLSIVFSVAMMVITYTLVSEKQLDAFGGLKKGNFVEGIKKDFKDVSAMAVQAKDEYQAGRSKAQYQGTSNAQGGMNQAQGAGTAQANAYGQTSQPFNGGAYVPTQLDTDRSIVAYILLGLITCGIYGLYMLHCMIQDVNVTCRGDGKETKGILEYILFGIITCGIYDYIWLYKFGNRIQENAPRYGMHFEESGTTILLWFVFGSLLCGIGPWIAMYYIIRNTNALNAAYNNMMAQQMNTQQNQ